LLELSIAEWLESCHYLSGMRPRQGRLPSAVLALAILQAGSTVFGLLLISESDTVHAYRSTVLAFVLLIDLFFWVALFVFHSRWVWYLSVFGGFLFVVKLALGHGVSPLTLALNVATLLLLLTREMREFVRVTAPTGAGPPTPRLR
jgi:hypothetical protein